MLIWVAAGQSQSCDRRSRAEETCKRTMPLGAFLWRSPCLIESCSGSSSSPMRCASQSRSSVTRSGSQCQAARRQCRSGSCLPGSSRCHFCCSSFSLPEPRGGQLEASQRNTPSSHHVWCRRGIGEGLNATLAHNSAGVADSEVARTSPPSDLPSCAGT